MGNYNDYTTRIGHDFQAPVTYDESCDGHLIRVSYAVFRVPSEKVFVLRMYTGATPDERARAERTLQKLPHGDWEELERQRAKGASKYRRTNGTYGYRIRVGHLVDDPLVQLELEMMIDAESPIENSVAKLREEVQR